MKKVISVLLCLCLALSVFTVVPFAASAAEVTEEPVGASSGTTGDCTWTLDDNGSLTISGNGAMGDYSYNSPSPWGTKIKTVIIEDGVTSIGKNAFYRCTGLTSVTIPDSVTSIGKYAFEDCTGLASVTIGNSVTSIGSGAFYNCKLLTSVTIPDSVTSIELRAFSHCSGLTSVTVAENNPVYDSRNGCNAIIETSTNKLIFGCQNTFIPDSVTSIGDEAFDGCTGLKSITIPDKVTSIGVAAFDSCTGLTSVTIPNSVTSIERYAFSGCKGLSAITIPDSVTYISYGAFYYCTSLTSISIPDSVTYISWHEFEGCSGLTSVIIPNSVTYIAERAFCYCSGLTSIIIPESVKTIGDLAFSGCEKLTIYGKKGSYAQTYAIENNIPFVVIETDIPTVSLFSTNNVASSQTVTISMSDNVGIKGYYWGTGSNYSNNTYTATSSTSVSKTVDSAGTYYATAVDTSGNVSSTVSITFYKTTLNPNANDASVSPTSVLTKSGNSFTFPTPTRSNYTYVGWGTSSSTSASNAVKTLSPTSNATYYAVWSYVDSQKPTASLSSTNNVASSQTVTISLSDNVGIMGYYWGTSSSYSNNSYTSTSSTSISKTVDSAGTYYATAVDTSGNVSSTVSITFYKTTLNANGGSVSPTSVLTKSGNSFTFPTPTCSNYTYVGWSTFSSATSGVKTLSPSSNTTYYAVWKADYKFVWGHDNWSFDNTSQYFSNYNVNSTVFNLMKQDFGLSNSQAYELNQAIMEDNYYGFGGSCFGMTVSEIMVKQGDLRLSRYGGNDVVNKNSNTSNMTSVINFIQELQSVSQYSQIIRQTPFMSGNYSQYDFIDKAESVLTNENIFVKISYGIKYLNKNTGQYSSAGYHAVLGYGIENCNYYSSVTGKSYDKRILIADPNYLSQNGLYGDSCIYYKSSDHSWICPYWNKSGNSYSYLCYWNASSGSSTNTGMIRNIMKYNSLTDTVDLMADYSVSHYISGLTVDNISGNSTTVEQIMNTGNPNLDYAGNAGSGIAQYNIEMDDSYNVNDNEEFYALWNPTANYSVSYSKPSSYNLKMDYEDIMYYANIKNGTYSLLEPNGFINLRGAESTYSITMVTDDSECVTDWYALGVSGNGADNLTFAKQNNGYLLSSNNLKNVTVVAKNNTVDISKTFSTTYDSVFIYEIDENTIGLKVDTDGNGTYETELPTDTFEIGDTNGDGIVNIRDVTAIQRHVADLEILTGTAFSVADTNGDGTVSIDDATHLQMYLAEYGVALGKQN